MYTHIERERERDDVHAMEARRTDSRIVHVIDVSRETRIRIPAFFPSVAARLGVEDYF